MPPPRHSLAPQLVLRLLHSHSRQWLPLHLPNPRTRKPLCLLRLKPPLQTLSTSRIRHLHRLCLNPPSIYSAQLKMRRLVNKQKPPLPLVSALRLLLLALLRHPRLNHLHGAPPPYSRSKRENRLHHKLLAGHCFRGLHLPTTLPHQRLNPSRTGRRSRSNPLNPQSRRYLETRLHPRPPQLLLPPPLGPP